MDHHPVGTDRPELRSLPQVQKLLEADAAQALQSDFPRARVVAAIRAGLALERAAIMAGLSTGFEPDRFLAGVRDGLERADRPVLRRVVNATGILIHTNLGRAPLARAAVEAVAAVAGGYSTLEFDLATGGRGSRQQAVETLLCEVTGAEAAVAVNNNAAAMLLALTALAAGGEVPVSRGELVEIGGSFRIPDIIRQGGARLVEVGTTNRTRIGDYEAAIGPETRLLLTVHPSNYRIVGFTAAPTREELVALGRAHGVPVLEDLGSGNLLEPPEGLPREPTVGAAVAAGVDLVCFSGDKLLGGPQAGLVVGRRTLVERLRRHPLMRALRPDKMSLAALEATLRLYRDPATARQELPVLRMLSEPLAAVERRAERLQQLLADIEGLTAEVVASEAMAGGGTLPEEAMPSRAVAVRLGAVTAEAAARRLRDRRLPVIGRISGGALLLDLRTVAAEEVEEIAAALGDLAP